MERSDNDVAAKLDSLEQLLIQAEDYGFHHARRNRLHYRTWAIVDLLYRLIAVLSAQEEEPGDDSKEE